MVDAGITHTIAFSKLPHEDTAVIVQASYFFHISFCQLAGWFLWSSSVVSNLMSILACMSDRSIHIRPKLTSYDFADGFPTGAKLFSEFSLRDTTLSVAFTDLNHIAFSEDRLWIIFTIHQRWIISSFFDVEEIGTCFFVKGYPFSLTDISLLHVDAFQNGCFWLFPLG